MKYSSEGLRKVIHDAQFGISEEKDSEKKVLM